MGGASHSTATTQHSTFQLWTPTLQHSHSGLQLFNTPTQDSQLIHTSTLNTKMSGLKLALSALVILAVFATTAQAVHPCAEPFAYNPPRSCMAYFEMWSYNQEAEECQEFVYGGCGVNNNNFQTQKECEDTCLYWNLHF